MKTLTRYAGVVIVATALIVPMMVGCNILQYQFCINNLTEYDLKEVNIVTQGSASWGANDLSGTLVPGGSEDIKGFAAGTYMVRGVFDVVDEVDICDEVINDEYIVINEGLEITTTNICIDYDEQIPSDKSEICFEIYGAPRFVI
ncbi:MAG: hypothetical protein WC655_15565 [Candidatus Hydrogenedentales bacterium]|jgi:hypothetical protein